MNFKRRLRDLECRPFHRPIVKPQFGDLSELDERIRKKLCLPLPLRHTPEEFEHAMNLMRAAQKYPIDDQSGWRAVWAYDAALHRKYGSVPVWGWPDDENIGDDDETGF